MTKTRLQQLLEQQYAELSFRAEELRSQLIAVEQELNDVEVAGGAVGLNFKKIVETKHRIEIERNKNRKTPTMKEAALLILERSPDGLTSQEILERMNKDFGFKYHRSSLSPQLSRLKWDNQVVQEGRIWKKKRAKEANIRS